MALFVGVNCQRCGRFKIVRNQVLGEAIAYEAPEDAIKCECGFTKIYAVSDLVDEYGNELLYPTRSQRISS